MSNPCFVFQGESRHSGQSPIRHMSLRRLIRNQQDEDHSRFTKTPIESCWTTSTHLVDFNPYSYLLQRFAELDCELIGQRADGLVRTDKVRTGQIMPIGDSRGSSCGIGRA